MLKYIRNIRDQIKEIEGEITNLSTVRTSPAIMEKIDSRKKQIEALTKSLENVQGVAKEELALMKCIEVKSESETYRHW